MTRASGKTLQQLYAEQILRPLGMRDTQLILGADQKSRLAKGYFANGAPAPWGMNGPRAMNGAAVAFRIDRRRGI